MKKTYCHIALVIAFVMALTAIPGLLSAKPVSAEENGGPALAAPKLINHAAGDSSIRNAWSAVKNAKGYEVHKATKINGKYKLAKTVKDAKTLSWTEKKLKENKFYFYKVRAYGYEGNRKVYGEFSSIQGAAPTEHPNWEYSISGKSQKTNKLSLTLTNKSRYSMVFDAEGLYLGDGAALKEWNKLETGQWKDMTKSQLKEKGLIYLKGKKVTVKPGKTAKLTYKAGSTVKYTKAGRIMSEFRYHGGTYGVFHSYKHGTSIWVY